MIINNIINVHITLVCVSYRGPRPLVEVFVMTFVAPHETQADTRHMYDVSALVDFAEHLLTQKCLCARVY